MARKIILWFLVLLLLGTLIYSYKQLRDRHPAYWLNIQASDTNSAILQAGFAKASINPTLIDTWVDKNRDARFRPDEGDTFVDRNGNGTFDAVWMAGFHNQRPAQGIHDTLWARAFVLLKGDLSLAVVMIDAIGFGNDEILEIRKILRQRISLDYVMVASTHSHQTPDLIGMWGPRDFKRGVDPSYRQLVIDQCVAAVVAAHQNKVNARFHYGEDLDIAEEWVEDSRMPLVKDAGLRILKVEDLDRGQVIGSLIGWANHPETLWSENLQISSDFPHYLRKAIEEGVVVRDSLLQEGIGGVSLFLNGAIGGLMTSSPRFAIPDPILDTSYLVPSFTKAKAQGDLLALAALRLLANEADTLAGKSLVLTARSIQLPMQNKLFRLGAWLGILDRGMIGWFKMRSEIAYWQLDQIGFLHVPGEIYPEIVNGGIESPPGQDFDIQPIEIPPLRELLPSQSAFVVGLSNDMIGYIIPKSEWDEEPPYLYHEHDSPYGEINSLGPDTGPLIHSQIFRMITDLNNKYPFQD